MSTSQKGTTLTLTDKDLSKIADRLVADERCAISKQGILNMIAAEIFSEKSDWGRIVRSEEPITSQRAEARMRDGVNMDLISVPDGAKMPITLSTGYGSINIEAKDGHMALIEFNDGCFKIHAYNDTSPAPVSLWSKKGHSIRALMDDHFSESYPEFQDAPETETDSWIEYQNGKSFEATGP